MTNSRVSLPNLVQVGGLLLLCGVPISAQNASSPAPTVRSTIAFDVSPPLRELARLPYFVPYGFHRADRLRFDLMPNPDRGPVVDPVEQSSVAGGSPSYSVGLNLAGVSDLGVGVLPSDANLAVGRQPGRAVGESVVLGVQQNDRCAGAWPGAGDQLWAGFGGYCETVNDGDVIAQWDKAAHRWVLFDNVIYSNPATACFAVSTTRDATGTYYRFAFPLYNQHNDNFPDYPKIGTWTNSYVQTQNNFGNSGDFGSNPCVYDRVKMLDGDGTAQQVCFQLTQRDSSLLPADVDSNTPPPAGQDVFLIGSVAKIDKSHLSLYWIHIDWSNPLGATITGSGDSQLIAVPTYAPACPGQQLGACAPELDGENLETISDRLMYRFVYCIDQPAAHVGPQVGPLPQQHWYTSHAVTASGGQVAMRWYEFRAPLKVDVTGMVLFRVGHLRSRLELSLHGIDGAGQSW